MNKYEEKQAQRGYKKVTEILGEVPDTIKYSSLEKRAARELYYQLGENRSLSKVYNILGIHLSTLKAWSTLEHWKHWAENRQKEDERLALQGKYSTQIMGLNAKAKAVLEEIIERGSAKINKKELDVRGSDVVNAAKELVRLEDADKTPDLNSAMVVVMVVDKKEYEKKKNIKATGNMKEIEIETEEDSGSDLP